MVNMYMPYANTDTLCFALALWVGHRKDLERLRQDELARRIKGLHRTNDPICEED